MVCFQVKADEKTTGGKHQKKKKGEWGGEEEGLITSLHLTGVQCRRAKKGVIHRVTEKEQTRTKVVGRRQSREGKAPSRKRCKKKHLKTTHAYSHLMSNNGRIDFPSKEESKIQELNVHQSKDRVEQKGESKGVRERVKRRGEGRS